MKWLIVLLCVAAFIALGLSARGERRLQVAIAIAIGFFPFFDITLNPISFENYRGDARGLEFCLVDFFSVAALVATSGRAGARSPLRGRFALYLAICALSAASALAPMFVGFATWKAARMMLLYTAAFRLVTRSGLGPQVLQGLVSGLILAGAIALKQRYLYGMMVATGPFSHQNGLAMAANMVTPTCYALMLAGHGGRLAKAGLAAGGIAVILTLSRGGLAMLVASLAFVYLASLAKQVNGRKLAFLGLSVLAAGAVLIKSFDTILERFLTAPKSSHEARELFERAAANMLADHPFGIGINHFSLTLDAHYADPLGIPEVDRDGIVHNIYWLTAAEMGYPGLIAFLLLFGGPLLISAKSMRRHRNLPTGDVQIGIVASLIVTFAQSKLEWALRITQVSFVFWVVAAVGTGLAVRRA